MSSSNYGPQRPPYVEFETRAVEDREASVKSGHYVAKDVDYAIIRALGAKDAVEKPAVAWLEHLEEQARRNAYPPKFAQFFREQYTEWKRGNDPQRDGIHVKNWPSISPAEASMLIAARIYTVEDLAAANEEALSKIGMGARGLKQRAQAWLDTVKGSGSAEELATLRERCANQDGEISSLKETLAVLQEQVKALTTGSGAAQASRKKAAA